MQLQAKIHDNETGSYERVVLCQFVDENDDKVFISEKEIDGGEFFHVLLDEGYSKCEYYYPVKRFTITELCIYE